jgi:pSer/pThr/pTyr-binding forkhead associated (FHA) protein
VNQAFITVKKGDAGDAGKIFTISKASTVIGRRTPQYVPDIELNDEVVSRRHLEIVVRDGKYLLQDMGSTNGTMLDGDRIVPGKLYSLKHNSRIGLGADGDEGHVVIVFKESESTNVLTGDKRKEVSKGKAAVVAWLKINEGKKEAGVDGQQVKLSRKEYDLLVYLHSNAGKVCSRDEIIRAVWPESQDTAAISDATIDQLVHRLREKVEPEPSQPARIISRKAFGYMLV